MKITTIQISGFRKILKATINMEDDITVIAGANNSGKTSIVELFNYVFNAKGALCSDDFPVYESQEYLSGIVDDDDYKLAELVPVVEVVHVADYLCNPRVSTQHGVKGESHDS